MSEATYDYKALPKKRMASNALFFNDAGNILIVKPIYRSDWLLPGGSVEANESPREACLREIKEELNTEIPLGSLLCVEYMAEEKERDECVQFTFYGGVLTPVQIQNIVLPVEELSEYRFSILDEVLALLSPGLAKRVPHCLEAIERSTTIYLEDGQRMG